MSIFTLIIELVKGSVELGLIYALVVLSVFLTSMIIRFDDLTVDGSFSTGGAVTAALLSWGFSTTFTLLATMLAGGLCGLATGLLHARFRLNNLMSGIIVTAALFSINLKIAGPMITMNQAQSIWGNGNHLLSLLMICGAVVAGIAFFLKTEIGLLLKALGANHQLLTALGKDTNVYKNICLVLANAITAFAGSLFVQHVGFFSIHNGTGTLAIALACLIIGQAFCKKSLAQVIIGSIIYQVIITTTIELQVDPLWNKFITAVLIVVLIVLRKPTIFIHPERRT